MKKLVGIFLLIFVTISSAAAQENSGFAEVTTTDISRLPAVELTVQGQDSAGQPIDFSNEMIIIRHDDELIEDVEVVGTRSVGTLALFLLDLTPGVQPRLGEIAASVRQYATPDFMQEQVDYVSVFQADEVGAVEQLAPTVFYNDVTNLFSIGVEPAAGATALYDSIGDMLARVEQLQPTPTTPTHLVVYSDGTDAISTQVQSADTLISRARQQNVPIHTVWLDNANLTFSAEDGRDFLQTLAEQTGGVFVALSETTELGAVWSQISAGGEQAVLRYIIPDITAGTVNAEVNLPNQVGVTPAVTSISIPPSLPLVTLDIADESRTFTLASVDEPTEIRVPATISWLDGQERGVQQVQLWHAGIPVAEVEPSAVNNIVASVPLRYGENPLKLIVVDEAGQQAQSTDVILSISEGADALPDQLSPGGGIPWQILVYILLCLAIIGLLVFLYFYLKANPEKAGGLRGRIAARRAAEAAKPVASDMVESKPTMTQQRAKTEAPTVAVAAEPDNTRFMPPTGQPTLEVLDSLSKVPTTVTLNRSEFLIGRSATVDLAFTDDPTVSRIHATIVQDGKIYRIYDEQSTSGTYVNDKQVPEYGLQLASGDEIHMGAVHLRFKQ